MVFVVGDSFGDLELDKRQLHFINCPKAYCCLDAYLPVTDESDEEENEDEIVASQEETSNEKMPEDNTDSGELKESVDVLDEVNKPCDEENMESDESITDEEMFSDEYTDESTELSDSSGFPSDSDESIGLSESSTSSDITLSDNLSLRFFVMPTEGILIGACRGCVLHVFNVLTGVCVAMHDFLPLQKNENSPVFRIVFMNVLAPDKLLVITVRIVDGYKQDIIVFIVSATGENSDFSQISTKYWYLLQNRCSFKDFDCFVRLPTSIIFTEKKKHTFPDLEPMRGHDNSIDNGMIIWKVEFNDILEANANNEEEEDDVARMVSTLPVSCMKRAVRLGKHKVAYLKDYNKYDDSENYINNRVNDFINNRIDNFDSDSDEEDEDNELKELDVLDTRNGEWMLLTTSWRNTKEMSQLSHQSNSFRSKALQTIKWHFCSQRRVDNTWSIWRMEELLRCPI